MCCIGSNIAEQSAFWVGKVKPRVKQNLGPVRLKASRFPVLFRDEMFLQPGQTATGDELN
jgi:hypothetical protein